MGLKVIEVRGHRIAVEAKTGTQLEFIKRQYEKRTDQELAIWAEETSRLHEKYPTRGIE